MKKFLNTIIAKIRRFDKHLREYTNSADGSAQIPYLAYVNWGINLSLDSDIDNAIEKLETSALMQPNSPIVQFNLGQVYMKKGRLEDAIAKLVKENGDIVDFQPEE